MAMPSAPAGSPGLLPFSSARKLMAAFHGDDVELRASVKGAPMAVLPRCDWMRTRDGRQVVDDAARQTLDEAQEALPRSGLRMLAVASGRVLAASEAGLQGLTFEGFVLSPIRSRQACRQRWHCSARRGCAR